MESFFYTIQGNIYIYKTRRILFVLLTTIIRERNRSPLLDEISGFGQGTLDV